MVARGVGPRAGIRHRHIDTAVLSAKSSVYRARLADALMLQIDVRIARRRFADARDAIAELTELAEAMPSLRHRIAAVALEAQTRGTVLSAAELERVAQSPHVSPVACRRARALLGVEVSLDVIDRAVLASIRKMSAWEDAETIGGGDEYAACWGLDHRSRDVWLPDGTVISFGTKALLWRLLAALADRGGEADKEAIVRAAWERDEYHPLRDDNRLHAAIRKLRRAIEDDPKSPARLRTTSTGYALGGPLRVVRV